MKVIPVASTRIAATLLAEVRTNPHFKLSIPLKDIKYETELRRCKVTEKSFTYHLG
jgi:hypothetical protein